MTEEAFMKRVWALRWGKRHRLTAALFAGAMAACGVQDTDSVGESLESPRRPRRL